MFKISDSKHTANGYKIKLIEDLLLRKEAERMSIEGLLLAAGQSSRMRPHHKLAMDLHGQTLLERSLGCLLPLCQRVIIVTGYLKPPVEAFHTLYPALDFVHNPNYENGMFSSVQAGLRTAKGERIFILPGDCPFVDQAVFGQMLQLDADVVIPSYRGQTGHPVLLSRKAVQTLLATPQYRTLKEFIDAQESIVTEVDCPGILRDIDTVEDFQLARDFFANTRR